VTMDDGSLPAGTDAVVPALGHGDLVPDQEERALADFARRRDLAYVGAGDPADAVWRCSPRAAAAPSRRAKRVSCTSPAATSRWCTPVRAAGCLPTPRTAVLAFVGCAAATAGTVGPRDVGKGEGEG
jgi:hypothetical protein